jgi:hypothetical protein
MIQHPTDCKIQFICVLNARNVKPADIHHQICEVYSENFMSDGMVRKWVTKFNEGRNNVHDKLQNSQPSSQAATFNKKRIQKLVPHYDKCLNNGENYLEK